MLKIDSFDIVTWINFVIPLIERSFEMNHLQDPT